MTLLAQSPLFCKMFIRHAAAAEKAITLPSRALKGIDPMTDRIHDPVRELVRIVARLRSPEGCPWDREQTVDSLRPYLLEECHELLAALDSGCAENISDELGDLLLQVVFIAQLFTEQGAFDLDHAASNICQKMVRRHPHVFDDSPVTGLAELDSQWDAIKRSEARNTSASLLNELPESMPALLSAQKITTKAARVGFDWQEAQAVIDKLKEEINELEEALADNAPLQIESELGDLLFTTVNLARHLQVDAETALRKTIARFRQRFRYIEDRLASENILPSEATLERMNTLWEQAKIASK